MPCLYPFIFYQETFMKHFINFIFGEMETLLYQFLKIDASLPYLAIAYQNKNNNKEFRAYKRK